MKKEIIQIMKENYSKEDYNYHILPVVKNALLLAKRLGADIDVVEAAAWLHDIGRALERKDFEKENEHHIVGAEKAREILKKLGYEKEFVEKVSRCILTHRGRKGPAPETIEEKIVACADAMGHFDAFLDLFAFFLESPGSFEKAVKEIEQKMQRDWDKKLILPEAKEIVREKFEAAMLLIKSMKEFIPK